MIETMLETATTFTIEKIAADLMTKCFNKFRDQVCKKRFETMIEQVAEKLSVNSQEASNRITEVFSTEWGYKLFERTFRKLMDSIHSKAEIAVSAMMAEYIADMKGPDREYQLAGSLLCSSDESVLRTLHTLSDQFVLVYPNNCTNDDDSFKLLRGQGSKSTNDIWFQYLQCTEGKVVRSDSHGVQSPSNLGIVLRLLDRHEYGSLPRASGYSLSPDDYFKTDDHPNGGEEQFYVLQGSESRWCRLNRYIKPAFQ